MGEGDVVNPDISEVSQVLLEVSKVHADRATIRFGEVTQIGEELFRRLPDCRHIAPGRPDGSLERTTADDEVAWINVLGQFEPFAIKPHQNALDLVHRNLRGRFIRRVKRLLVLLASETEPGDVDVALLAHIGHNELRVDG